MAGDPPPERSPNARDPAHRWHVVNLAMGGWIAYQELIALDLYGTEFDADWIVLFDGRNDIWVPTVHGELVPNYFLFSGQRRLNGLFDQEAGTSWLERLGLFRYRRLLDGLARVSQRPPPMMSITEARRGVAFYLHSVARIAERLAGKSLLIMAQPIADYGASGRLPYLELIAETQSLVARWPAASYVDGTKPFPAAARGARTSSTTVICPTRDRRSSPGAWRRSSWRASMEIARVEASGRRT